MEIKGLEQESVSPPTVWVLDLELRLSALATSSLPTELYHLTGPSDSNCNTVVSAPRCPGTDWTLPLPPFS